MKRLIVAFVGLTVLAAAGCSKPADTYTPPTAKPPTAAPAEQKPALAVAPKGDTVNISAEDFIKKMKAEKLLVIDVRTEEEYAQGHVVGSKLVPLQTIEQGITKYAKDQEIYLICQSGNRSAQAYTILSKMGYTKLHNVVGGTVAYKALGGLLEL